MSDNQPNLKILTARSIKWNLIDRVATQVLYGVTGIILARLLSQEDFGLVGAVLVFQAFASLFVDSGFSSALIQRKSPTRLDYSTVMWFNIGMATMLYVALWFLAPLIADWFQGDRRLVPLSRVMFVTFILSATAIVQTNRLMKQMNVRLIAATNAIGLTAGAIVGITLAVMGYGAWALVWQTLVLTAVKSLSLWMSTRWVPLMQFSWKSLKSFLSVGSGVMFTSFLNTLFQNIYSFFIGNRVGMVSLGYYTQSDKWSKMGIMSINQVLTSSFLPLLSEVQDDRERFARVAAKTSRFTSYLAIPAMGFCIVMATPIFHALFGSKWDASIVLFQLLLVRGVFYLFTSLYSNYLLALGRAKLIVAMESLRDGVALVALLITLPMIGWTAPGDPVYGIEILLWGQVVAAGITWVATMITATRLIDRNVADFLLDMTPYLLTTGASLMAMWALALLIDNAWLLLASQGCLGLAIYVGVNWIAKSKIQADALEYILGRFHRH